ncbi:hypothetical protein MTO96_006467 [Rhipicephalus appendiculatus]
MDGSPDQPFAALKEVAARLDVEIPNAANCLEGLPGLLETKSASTNAATKVFEQATIIEAELKLIVLRIEKVVKEKLASIQELTECLKQTDWDNREALQKLQPLGFKAPVHLMPAKAAAGSSQVRMSSQVCSQLSRSLQQPCSSKPGSRSQPRRFQTSSNLDKYLEEIANDDTITLMKYKPLMAQRAAKPAAAPGSPDKSYEAPMPEKPELSPGFPSLKGSLPEVTFISGIKPLPKTPELTGKPAGQEENRDTWRKTDWKFKASCPLTPKAPDCEEHGLKFRECRPTTSKTPELMEFPTPVLKVTYST